VCGNDNIDFNFNYQAQEHSRVICRECGTRFWLNFYVLETSISQRELLARPGITNRAPEKEVVKIGCGTRYGPCVTIKRSGVEWTEHKSINIRKGIKSANIAIRMQARLDAYLLAEAMKKADGAGL
jgi:hypothetical protein